MRTMALSWSHLPLISLILLSLASLGVSTDGSSDIRDILSHYNLPKGILPNVVNSYTITQDGSFTVHMDRPCYVKFLDDQLVYYDKLIKGTLSYGKVSQVSGIQAKKFFLWLPVTGMQMDTGSDMVEFYVGALSQKLPAKQFQTVPACMNKARLASELKTGSFWVNYYF